MDTQQSKRPGLKSLAAFWIFLVGLLAPQPAHAGWLKDAYNYWASGELGMRMFEAVGIDEDELTEIVIDAQDTAEAVSKKVRNTAHQIAGNDDCVDGPTLLDDLKPIQRELYTLWEYKGQIPVWMAESMWEDLKSGATRDRLLAYGEGVVTGAYETGKETLFLAADGISYGYLVATTDGDEQYMVPNSQIVSAYWNSDDAGEVTGQLLSGIAQIPGQIVDDLANDNPGGIGETVGSFIAPASLFSKGQRTARQGTRATVATQTAAQSTRAIQRVAPAATGASALANQSARAARLSASSVPIRVATQPKALNIPGKLVKEYDYLDMAPVHNPHLNPLKSYQQATFSGSRYAEVELGESLTVYRVHNQGQPTRVWNSQTRRWEDTEGATEFGGYWSLEKPAGSTAARIDSAVLPEWGNDMTHVTAIELPKGSTIYVGEAANQGGFFVGGGSQLIVKGQQRGQIPPGARVVDRFELPAP